MAGVSSSLTYTFHTMPSTAHSVQVVIPCYNEAGRLPRDEIVALLRVDTVGIVTVDDGSTDDTLRKLWGLAADHPGRITVVAQPHNRGKAEAVRLGLRTAIAEGAAVVAYCDADFATPASEIIELTGIINRHENIHAAFGSRIARLGSSICRSTYRHYLGRVFATAASATLGMTVYDTQCGAKAFRVTQALKSALATPFQSRWVFDVELIGRLYRPRSGCRGLALDEFLEVPLRRWNDVDGSRLTPADAIRSGLDLARFAWTYRRPTASHRRDRHTA